MTDNSGPAPPITVRASAATDLVWQSARALVIFAAGAGTMQVYHSEVVVGLAVAAATAVFAAVPAFVAWAFGFVATMRQHHVQRTLAEQVPDSVAQVVGR